MRGLALSRWHWLVAFIIVTNVPSTLADGPLFQQFFPGWDGLIHKFLKENCTDDLDEYNKNPMGQGKWDVIDCLFDGPFTETRKAEAAAAALTPGLAPMVLQTIGPNTSETSLLFLRRPLLALLLAISSPWPRNPDDNAIYENPSVDYPVWPAIDNEPARIVVVLVEYVVAMGAAANVALLAYQLGHWSFFMSANNVNDPVWWTYCSFLIHLIGILGIFFRFQVLMGTIMLSGSLLTNQADARNCLFRYVCSAIAARALLSYELAYVTRHVEHRGAKSWVKEGTRNGTGLSDSLFHG
ncbi:hypothetical protein RB213_005093 [Colletotrichum asianum]